MTHPMPLELKILLDQINAIPESFFDAQSIEDRRKAYETFSLMHGGKILSLPRVEDVLIEGRLSLRVYTPVLNKRLPVLFYIHGGGWQRGSLSTHDSICRRFASYTNHLVVAVDWRLAPEHPFPAGLEDVHSAHEWILSHIHQWNGYPDQLIVVGDSAGGNLTASFINQLVHEKKRQIPRGQVLLYPALDLTVSQPSYKEFEKGFFLTTHRVQSLVKDYLPPEADPFDPRVSPFFQKNLKGLPPTFIITAEYDPLRDEGEAYHRKLLEQGVESTLYRAPQMIHAFLHLTGTVPGVESLFQEIISHSLFRATS